MKHTIVILAYKESEYLEECICSVLNQTARCRKVIATSTPNAYIQQMAEKYDLELLCNPKPGLGIGYDFDFARTCTGDDLVTIAHQDDIYEPNYAKLVQDAFRAYPTASILFSDYYEIRNHKKIYSNINLGIKRVLLLFARLSKAFNSKLLKRATLCFGNPISCPAVTFVNENIQMKEVFSCDLKCNVDWNAWERLSKEQGRFVYIPQPLMGHRVHDGSTTTEIIQDKLRTKEDLIIFKRFWPGTIAKLINGLYIKSQNSNIVK